MCRNTEPQCAWCLARAPIKLRLFGLDLCADCAPPTREADDGKYADDPYGFIVRRRKYKRLDKADMHKWLGRRMYLIKIGWRPGDMPPRLEV